MLAPQYSLEQWGHHTLSLQLPVGTLHLEGLSQSQCNALADIYARLADATLAPATTGYIHCRAYRLPAPLAIPIAELTVDGQYTPRNQRIDAAMDITGVNFCASMDFAEERVSTSLGVATEDELVETKVFQNFLRILTAYQALNLGGVMLHSAGLVFDGLAYLFVGRSGAGKTTLTRKAFAAGATILSDDINLLLPSEGGLRAHALPFMGDFGLLSGDQMASGSFPVVAIALLQQGDRLQIEENNAADSLARLLVGSPFVNADALEADTLLDNLGAVLGALPVLSLTSRRDDTIDAIMTSLWEAIEHE